ncbi:MAG: hypothetical protein JWO37_3548 [Acidimicrobiales bacterium]|nr:hypothetical protein [Acidimicrobiales bacterium]
MSDVTGGGDDWVVEPAHPQLQGSPKVDRINDPKLADRLTWNTFRTLSEWDTDAWIPAMLEIACGVPNPLSGKEWGDARVEMWGSGLDLVDTADVLLDGPEAVVVVEASYRDDLPPDHAIAGLRQAFAVADQHHHRQAGYVMVSPDRPRSLRDQVTQQQLESEFGGRPGLDVGALSRAIGWISWRDLGRLALDLAEEADDLRDELVHRLVTELQVLFPGIEI